MFLFFFLIFSSTRWFVEPRRCWRLGTPRRGSGSPDWASSKRHTASSPMARRSLTCSLASLRPRSFWTTPTILLANPGRQVQVRCYRIACFPCSVSDCVRLKTLFLFSFSGYLFEGHLTVDPEPPQPHWLVQSNLLNAAAVMAAADSSSQPSEETAATLMQSLMENLDDVFIPVITLALRSSYTWLLFFWYRMWNFVTVVDDG